MSRLSDLSKDKITVMERLLDSNELCKAVYYNERDFLNQPVLSNPYELIYEHIFPYRKVPKIDEKMKTYITMSFKNYSLANNRFKSGYIYINIFTHHDLVRTDYGVLRYDFIASEIDKLMNEKRGIGIGKIEFYDMDELFVNEKYLGVYLAYKLYEFN